MGKKITVESLRTEVLPAERGMSKAIGVRKGIWARGDGGRRSKRSQNKDVIGFFLGYEQNIFLGSLEDLPLLFWRMWDPYWWNKSNVLPPVISQFWFIVAGVMVILLSIKREKLPAIVIANPHILQLQLIFFSFFFAPIASSAIEIILFAASRVRMRKQHRFCLSFGPEWNTGAW